ARTNVDVTLVSFDSERDTPAELAKYRKAWNLPADWELLSGKNDDVRELAALLGIQFKKTADAGFAHSNVITLLNQDGEVVFQQTGLEAKPDEMRRKIAQLLK
ncbi:MAG TPA: SCO family protein, partial [Verrucomicrobiae bacterium]|nr:SCO family protein [Verrucomicrobiae bacterium]